MERPLWQILFTLTYSAFVVQRAAVAWVLHEEQRAPILMLLWGVQIAAALATAVGVWIGNRCTARAFRPSRWPTPCCGSAAIRAPF
jgi:hypothetical protein